MQPSIRIILIILITLVLCFSQPSFIPIMVDYSCYKSSSQKSFLEVYLSFFQNNLNYIKENGQYRASYTATAQILQDKTIIDKHTKRTESIVDSLSLITPDRQFVNLFSFEIPEGSYNLKIIVQDDNSVSSGEYITQITAKSYLSDSLQMSDIQLASKIARENPNSEFNKNTFCVMPNPSNTYNITMPVLYYYTEIYNLHFQQDLPGQYGIKCTITDREGNIVKDFPEKIKNKAGKSVVSVDGFNIVTLPTNIYFLNLAITDKQNGHTLKKSKRFIFQKPGKELATEESGAVSRPEETEAYLLYGHLSEEQLDIEFAIAQYIASREEIEIYKTLDYKSKMTFLYNFWNRKDKENPGQDATFKQQYFERVNIANSLFSVGKLDGWRSERGKVLLKYGSPNEWERFHMEIDMKPYEIWTYHNLEGGVIFVFGDIQGAGDFELLHSTFSQELHNPDWQRLVKRAEGSIFDETEDFGF
jgi:GWxTD domain-containing protein